MKNFLLSALTLIFSVSAAAQFPNDISTLQPGVSETCCNWGRVEIAPGQEHELARFDGAGVITYFYLTDGRGGIQDRNLVLRIYWDGMSRRPISSAP